MSINEIIICQLQDGKATDHALVPIKESPWVDINTHNEQAEQANYIATFDTLKGKPISLRLVAVC